MTSYVMDAAFTYSGSTAITAYDKSRKRWRASS